MCASPALAGEAACGAFGGEPHPRNTPDFYTLPAPRGAWVLPVGAPVPTRAPPTRGGGGGEHARPMPGGTEGGEGGCIHLFLSVACRKDRENKGSTLVSVTLLITSTTGAEWNGYIPFESIALEMAAASIPLHKNIQNALPNMLF